MNMASFLEHGIKFYLDRGGSRVTNDQYKQRLDVCNTCERSGTVSILGVGKTPGCLECGCPFATKPLFAEFFNPLTFQVEEVFCPLGKWEPVDKLFKK